MLAARSRAPQSGVTTSRTKVLPTSGGRVLYTDLAVLLSFGSVSQPLTVQPSAAKRKAAARPNSRDPTVDDMFHAPIQASASMEFFNDNRLTRVRARIQGDQFTINWAESIPELVGVTWKIGCVSDAYPQYGISSNSAYPYISSIFLKFSRSACGQESLNEGVGVNFLATVASNQQLVSITTTATTSSPTP